MLAAAWCGVEALCVFSVCDESLPGITARKTLKQFHDVMSSADNPLDIFLSKAETVSENDR